MQIEIGPRMKRRFPWASFPVAISSLIIGYVAIGPIIFAVFAGTIGAVLLLLLVGPRINDRLYGSHRSPEVALRAPASLDHRAGSLEIGRRSITWIPRRRRLGRLMVLRARDLTKVQLESSSGFPQSCRITCKTSHGVIQMTITAPAERVEVALRQLEPD